MSAPTEKHREEGERIAFDRFSLTRAFDVDRLLLAGNIAAALADAEERGMKRGLERAAEIARLDVDWSRFGKQEVHEPWENGPDDARDYRVGIVAARSIATAILSEITQSAAASSRATAEAGEGVPSSPSSPAPIPSPERGSGSPDSAIFTARPSSGDSRSAARGPLENAHESPTGDPIHDEAPE